MKKVYLILLASIVVNTIGAVQVNGKKDKAEASGYKIKASIPSRKTLGIELSNSQKATLSGHLTLAIDEWENKSFILTDSNQFIRMSSVLSNKNTSIKLFPYSAGTYYLKVNEKGKTIVTYTIIKK